jgi:hypothetical protein
VRSYRGQIYRQNRWVLRVKNTKCKSPGMSRLSEISIV